MAKHTIGTSSYSEVMDLSDIDETGYEHKPFNSTLSTNSITNSMPANSSQSIQPNTTNSPNTPVKIRKKPGRKPNPASPALRKAQNRAAQRAFRERKEKHMKDLESSVRGIKEQRDNLLRENKKYASENEILKAENWYLKGIVLSLQLVCLQHNLVIPQHCPHVNDQTLSVLAQSIPESISSYLDVNARNKLPMAHKIMNGASDPSVRETTSILPALIPGSVVITKNGVHTVTDTTKSEPHNDWNKASTDVNMPSLSPMTEYEKTGDQPDNSTGYSQKVDYSPSLIAQPREPVTSNLAAIQTLRLRLRLQSACVGMQSTSFTIQPTLLQLSIPHDPRIDLVPTPHMRDRMILYRDQFDLDDCFQLLLNGSVFHGGDPAVAGNWELPAEFFEKYWFLTIDYNLRRNTNEWRKKQGLRELQSHLPLQNLNEGNYSISSSSVTSSPPSFQLPVQPQSQPSVQQPTYVQSPPNSTNSTQANFSYDKLSAYFDMQMNIDPNSQISTQIPQQQQIHPNLVPAQLTNGYKMIQPITTQGTNSLPVQSSFVQQQAVDDSFLGSKDYNMLMTGMHNGNYR